MGDINYYVGLFSPQTWSEFIEHGATITGFSEKREKAANKLKQGDILIAYLTRQKRIVGILEVQSELFVDNFQIWQSGVFPFRVKVNTLAQIENSTAPTIESIILSLSEEEKVDTRRRWLGWIRASPTKISSDIGKLITDTLRNISSPSGNEALETREEQSHSQSALKGVRDFHSVAIHSLLSFGAELTRLELFPINILIGPNGSGKTNLIESLNLLRSTTSGNLDLYFDNRDPSQWKHKGPNQNRRPTIEVEIRDYWHLDYAVSFHFTNRDATIFTEEIDFDLKNEQIQWRRDRRGYLSDREHRRRSPSKDYELQFEANGALQTSKNSITQWPRITSNRYSALLIKHLRNIKIYRLAYMDLKGLRENLTWRDQEPISDEVLSEDGTNLLRVLSKLRRNRLVWRNLINQLRQFNPRIEELSTEPDGAGYQVFAGEENLTELLPASRLSDGTLRYLYLLAILLDPAISGLVCIEEPEIGLHPDILSNVGKLLREARYEAQIIVSTHSDHLVNSFSDIPDAVVICEQRNEGTQFSRLDASQLTIWLEEYSLGHLWLRGEFGGTRW